MSKPEVCRYFIRGRCTYGDRCRYHHPGVGKQSDYSKRRAMGGVVSFQIASDVIGPGGNRYQYLDNDRWERDNSGGYRGNYDHRSRNYGYQNPRQGSGYRQQPQWNDQYNKRGQQYAGSWSQNWRSSSRNPNGDGGHHGSFSGRSSHPQASTDPVTPREIMNAIQQDMNEWRSSSAWPLSCYAYKKEGECLPNFTEVSPEELRWEAYQANKAGNPDTYMQSVHNLIETQMKVWQQYSNITDEEVSQMLSSGTTSLFGSHNSGLSSLFGPSESNGPSNTSIFGSPGSLFGTKSQESGFGSGFQLLFGSSQSPMGGGGLSPQSSSDNQTTRQPPAATAQTITSGENSASSVTASQSTDYQLTEEELQAFKSDKFVLGQIPEHPPPEELCE